MSATLKSNNDSNRSSKLNKLFNNVIHGEDILKTAKNGDLFIEALCGQPDPPACIEKIISSPKGLSSIQACVRFNASPSFQNGPATALLRYIQSPEVKAIFEGEYLRTTILDLVDPPIFWNALLMSFRKGLLVPEAQQCFGWLLSELLCLPAEKGMAYRAIAQDASIQGLLFDSSSLEVRKMGQRIKHILSTIEALTKDDQEYGPGGRHDNDFSDFREIAIHPTADEILSEVEPFLRLAETIDDPENKDTRLAIHLDNQFRLLREDMLAEMRDELQIIFGKKPGRHRGLVIEGLQVVGVDCGDPKRRRPWGMRLQCTSDLSHVFQCKPKARKDFLKNNRNVFKHQALTCLILDGEIAAFPTIHRDIDELAEQKPIISLQFVGKSSTIKTLLRFKTAIRTKLVQIDTAVFAFEPVLQSLQELSSMPLTKELLFWDSGSSIQQPPHAPIDLISGLESNPGQDLQTKLDTSRSIQLDDSQAQSLRTGLKQRISLIQGPPGTGKSFIGALIAKSIHRYTGKIILVVCFTNHALDQFLEDLLDIGIPSKDMLRLGGKSTPRTSCLALYDQTSNFKQTQASWKIIEKLKEETNAVASRLHHDFARYSSASTNLAELLQHLEFLTDGAEFYEAFLVPKADDGSHQVGKRGRIMKETYLIEQWSQGRNAGVFSRQVKKNLRYVWDMPISARQNLNRKWRLDMLKEQVSDLYATAEEYNQLQAQLNRMFQKKDTQVIASRRIIACTTTAAAKYSQQLRAASRDIVMVEEAGEILESHILTALGPQTEQLILIGDHKQLRPKVNDYKLTVEKGDGYDLNRSLFERLILKGYPHQTLHQQHRMRPEISSLVQSLTYPELIDAERTKNRSDIRGLQDNVIWVSHEHPEDDLNEKANWKNMSSISSKQNRFEVDMVLKCVRYLAQQGYGTEKIVVLTPYLAQLRLLQQVLSRENDPILNDLDSFDLVRAGLLPASSAKLNQRKIHLSTIDNYQGEESDIVIASMTRSNPNGDIGFMAAPERLNVLLSRARDGLILIGNIGTFSGARKGQEIWSRLFTLLKKDGRVYEGLPVKCERHPKRTAILRDIMDFEIECPDGGCKEPCGTMLNCGLHLCPQKCHQLFDHSKVQCEHVIQERCPAGHKTSRKCHKTPLQSCTKCEEEAKRAQADKQRALELQDKREREDRAHAARMAKLDAMLDEERQRLKDRQRTQERELAIRQKEQDIAKARALVDEDHSSSLQAENHPSTSDREMKVVNKTVSQTSLIAKQVDRKLSDTNKAESNNTVRKRESSARQEWQEQKTVHNASNEFIDFIMDMVGLEEVKIQILRIKDKVDASIRQNTDVSGERMNASLLGNPGTGKTTVARLYAKVLSSLGALPSDTFVETTGSRLANDGVAGAKKHLEDIHKAGGGALFVDEAYQLVDQHNYGGRQVLDFLLVEMENNVGKIVFILAGYSNEMEKFFEHNPGLTSRVPYTLHFTDYEDDELLWMLQQRIDQRYKGRMNIQDGKDGLYMRIATRRLGRLRGRPGFGNARALQSMYDKVAERQAGRLARERKDGLCPDDFFISKEDLIGPDPSEAILKRGSWDKLQELTGLKAVKESIRIMIDRISLNYNRELNEKEPVEISLNRVFLGNPGVGKTSVAKLYGRILADFGLLSKGEVVVKNPADFIGSALGQSEANTKAILASTLGKVLIIDEAYMLYSGNGGSGNQSDTYKTAVIDTIVAEVQSVPGEDRCVLLLGYEEQIRTMFQNVNPGLSRRFAIESAFHFEDFTNDELLEILELKMRHQDLNASKDAKSVAIEVLSRSRNRPNFGNAGEVENLLGLAKGRHQARQSSQRVSSTSADVIFEPEDFDPDFKRGENAGHNLQKLFEDVVGCDALIEKLAGYQQIAQTMKIRGIQPRGMIPTNFLFKGPPGTGKTTTARKMGQVFYDKGFLSKVEVVECSASDLIGSYVGQTGPKTRSLLEKALGKILFIDEAYRLSEGSYATEAINELVDLLTKPAFIDKIVVILAGYDKDINKLIAVNPGLSSRFPEQIVFENMSPVHCLEVLQRSIIENGIRSSDLTDSTVGIHRSMVALLGQMASLPSWGNARDIKTLAKSMIGSVFRTQTSASGDLVLPDDVVLRHTQEMLRERQERSSDVPSPTSNNLLQELLSSQQAPTAPLFSTNIATEKADEPPEPLEPPIKNRQDEEAAILEIQRDDGVPEKIWQQLQADIQAAKAKQEASEAALQKQASDLANLAAQERDKAAALQQLEKAKAEAKTRAANEELKRKQEQARLEENVARIAREKAKAELERLQRLQRERQKREQQAQAKLRQMGVCEAGYRWIKQSGGYCCAGGSHYVSDGQLGL